MSLHKIIADVTDANENEGVINRQAAITAAVPQILADDDLTEMCVRGHVSRLIASNARSRTREAGQIDPRQASFFGLRDTHVLDDGEGHIKRTSALNRIEFAGLISVRQQQVDADLAYLSKLRDAAKRTAGIWDRNPDWAWGQVEAAYARSQRAAA